MSRTPPFRCQPTREFVLIFEEERFDVSPNLLALAERRVAAVAGDDSEELIVARAEYLKPSAGIVLPVIDGERNHAAEVVGAAIVIGNDDVGIGLADIAAGIVSAVEVVEGRDSQHASGVDSVQPGKIDQVIALVFHVANARGLLVGIVGNLVMIAAGRKRPGEAGRWVSY